MKNRYFKWIASVRFAIPVLSLFAIAMSVGTVLESLYGTEYARRTVYQSWFFYGIQLSILLSVLFAMIDRLPFKKRLSGFYLIHTSLIIIMAGAFMTRYLGIDGTIELREDAPTQKIRLSEDYAYFNGTGQQSSFQLPDTVSATSLNHSFLLANGAKLSLIKYLPYAKETPTWVTSVGVWSSTWLIKNDRVSQETTLVLAPGEPALAELGPLRVEALPPQVFAILENGLATPKPGTTSPSRSVKPQFVLFDNNTQKSFFIPEVTHRQSILGSKFFISRQIGKKAAVEFYQLDTPTGPLRFFPRFSAKPATQHLQVDLTSPYSLIDLTKYSESNHVLLSRLPDSSVHIAMVDKSGQWIFSQYNGGTLTLPWMGFTLTRLADHPNQRPKSGYDAAQPNKEDSKNTKALLVHIEAPANPKDSQKGAVRDSEDVWLTNREATSSRLGLEESFISAKEMQLPFAMQLDHFKMEMVPGTMDRPASYESFVKVGSPESGKQTTAHIYMNHPLKSDGYTFYQASYLQDDQGKFHSILSVNKDPGRPVKYLGSILLIAGLIFHFLVIYGYITFRSREVT
ncbi:cytochrome c biogenesis protein ResB [Bdellovibrionota bacterium FG-1]